MDKGLFISSDARPSTEVYHTLHVSIYKNILVYILI